MAGEPPSGPAPQTKARGRRPLSLLNAFAVAQRDRPGRAMDRDEGGPDGAPAAPPPPPPPPTLLPLPLGERYRLRLDQLSTLTIM